MLKEIGAVLVSVFLFAPLGFSDQFEVSLDGGGDFQFIQQAVNAASDGDVIWVRRPLDSNSRHPGFVIDGKAITIHGQAADGLLTGPVKVKNIPFGKAVVLRGLDMNRYSNANIYDAFWTAFVAVGDEDHGLEVTNCFGSVRLQDCSMEGTSRTAEHSGLYALDALDVTAVDCQILGGPVPWLSPDLEDGTTGLHGIRSRIALHDCGVLGGQARLRYNEQSSVGTGGRGVELEGRSLFWAHSSLIQGGTGSPKDCSAFGVQCFGAPGDGGVGMEIGGQALCFLADTVVEGGAVGPFRGIVYDGPPPSQGLDIMGSPFVLGPTQYSLDVNRTAYSGDSSMFTGTGNPGDEVKLLVSEDADYRFLGVDIGPLLVRNLVQTSSSDWQTVDASGQFNGAFALPQAVGNAPKTYLVQAVLRQPGSSDVKLSNLATVTVQPTGTTPLDGWNRVLVDPETSVGNTGDGQTWATAKANLASALIDAAHSSAGGAEVWLRGGLYTDQDLMGSSYFSGLSIRGGFAGNETNASQADPVGNPTVWDLPSSTLCNFESCINFGTMMYPAEGMLFDGIEFAGNGSSGSDQRSVIRSVGSIRFQRSVFRDFDVSGQVIPHRGGSISVERCIFYGNTFESSLVRFDFVDLEFVGNLVTGNTMRDFPTSALEASFPKSVRISQNTMAHNFTPINNSKMVSIAYPVDEVDIANNIFWENDMCPTCEDLRLSLQGTNTAEISVRYNNVENPSAFIPSVGHTSKDPIFFDALGPDLLAGTGDEDFRLRRISELIDAGDSFAVPIGLTLDLGGLPRILDRVQVPDRGIGNPDVVDLGAYEKP